MYDLIKTKIWGNKMLIENNTNTTISNEVSPELRSSLVSRNVTIQGRRTSVRLEPEMWKALTEVSKREKCSSHEICTLVSLRKKPNTSLTAAIRVFVMLYFRAASTEVGHERSGHGNFEFMRARARMIEKSAARMGVNSNDWENRFTPDSERDVPRHNYYAY